MIIKYQRLLEFVSPECLSDMILGDTNRLNPNCYEAAIKLSRGETPDADFLSVFRPEQQSGILMRIFNTVIASKDAETGELMLDAALRRLVTMAESPTEAPKPFLPDVTNNKIDFTPSRTKSRLTVEDHPEKPNYRIYSSYLALLERCLPFDFSNCAEAGDVMRLVYAKFMNHMLNAHAEKHCGKASTNAFEMRETVELHLNIYAPGLLSDSFPGLIGDKGRTPLEAITSAAVSRYNSVMGDLHNTCEQLQLVA